MRRRFWGDPRNIQLVLTRLLAIIIIAFIPRLGASCSLKFAGILSDDRSLVALVLRQDHTGRVPQDNSLTMSVEALFQKQAKKKKEEGGATAVTEDPSITEAVKQEIQKTIDDNQVVVFSKSYCPFCRQAKMTFNSIENLEYKVVEMDDGSHEGWQAYIAELAKTRAIPCAGNNNTKSVPQIFVNKKYIGGAEDLAELYADKSLAEMLGRSY